MVSLYLHHLTQQSDIGTPGEITNDVLIIPNPSIPFTDACEFEKNEISKDDTSVYADQFDGWYVFDGEESGQEDVTKVSLSNVDGTHSQCPGIATIHLFQHPLPKLMLNPSFGSF